MTKTVRVENGDSNTSFKVVVEVWDKAYPPGSAEDKLADTFVLGHPTAMKEVGITSSRYLTIKEAT